MKRAIPILLTVAFFGGGCTASQLSSVSTPTQAPAQELPKLGASLDLHNSGLTSIPSNVFSRTELEQLDLSDNLLTGAPQAEIRHLQNLRVLDLSGNKLTGLPAELGQLKRLEVLDVSNNQLTGLPLELGNLTQLRVLDLSGNAYSTKDLDQIAAKLSKTEIRR